MALCKTEIYCGEFNMILHHESTISNDGLTLAVYEHDDSPGEYVICTQRHGMSERICRTATEVRLLGDSLRLAGLRLLEKDNRKRKVPE